MGRNIGTYIEGICQDGTCVNQVYLEESMGELVACSKPW